MKRFAIFLYVAAYLGLAGCSTDLATPGLIEARDAGGQVSGLWHSILRAGRLPAAPEQPQAQLTLSIPNQNWQAQFVPVAKKAAPLHGSRHRPPASPRGTVL